MITVGATGNILVILVSSKLANTIKLVNQLTLEHCKLITSSNCHKLDYLSIGKARNLLGTYL